MPSDSSRPIHILVAGAGISGLAFAAKWKALCSMTGSPLQLTLLEARKRTGGMIATRRESGLIMEEGPESFITEKPWALDLARREGLEDQLMPTRTQHRRSYILRGGSLRAVPEGFYLMAPSRMMRFLTSGIISWKGKLRMMMEPWIPPRLDTSDESVASFVLRRFGTEVLERIAQPMIGGIYSADPASLSLLSTFPKFSDMERTSGSVLRGLQKFRRTGSSASGPRYGLFVSFREGMQTLPDKLEQGLSGCRILKGEAVEALSHDQTWHARLASGQVIEADAVCLALPARESARLLRAAAPSLSGELAAIEHESAVTINLVYRDPAVLKRFPGFGFVVPGCENRTLLGCTFSTLKYENRSPEGLVLLRAFLGGRAHRPFLGMGDGELAALVHRELSAILGGLPSPIVTRVARFPYAMPQYHVGHRDRVLRIREETAACDGLGLAGNAYGGVGIPDCVRTAEEEALRLFQSLVKAGCEKTASDLSKAFL